MARKPIAPGANGRRNRAIASLGVRAGGAGPAAAVLRAGMVVASGEVGEGRSGGECARADVESGLSEKAGGAAGGAAAADVAAGEHEPVLGAGGGDVEQSAFLFEVVGVVAGQRTPGGQELFLAA